MYDKSNTENTTKTTPTTNWVIKYFPKKNSENCAVDFINNKDASEKIFSSPILTNDDTRGNGNNNLLETELPKKTMDEGTSSSTVTRPQAVPYPQAVIQLQIQTRVHYILNQILMNQITAS
ncbi:unnamed protein product [Diabrotica balteata]|uniref:Uncharacterized protein n=1 Tax=Diabrotica balteata TaxID=107213 RepID=A0A9N9SZ59_DIABA|nr:unnamed protein product [Diabrotica balteata]